MQYAVISDVHANLEALTTVLQEIDKQHVDEIVSLGDIVGYGANPNECFNLLLERNVALICGNHDIAAIDSNESHAFNEIAKKAAQWTYTHLSQQYKEIIATLPHEKQIETYFLMVHGALTDRNDYITEYKQAKASLDILKEKFDVRLCFFGHTHRKRVWGPIIHSKTENKTVLPLNQDGYHLINPGSVGQPRDGDNRASFLIFDAKTWQIQYFLLEYDIEQAQEKIISSGLPKLCAKRLSLGT